MPVPYNDWLATLTRKAQLRAKAGLERNVTPRGHAIDLAGNDYLGLSRHPLVVAAATSALASYGLGATGSRLVRGTTSLHAQLEEELAQFLGTQSALVYSSGYLANLGAIRALASLSPNTVLISDAHCHASMIDGCRLSGATVKVFGHGDVSHAASLIEPGRPSVLLTESVFSVDGDLAPLRELHVLARSTGSLLLIDDAHGLGVGSFLTGLAGEPDVIITATLSKSLGGAGGVVGGPPEFIRHLIDTSRTFIFDTALPPAVAAGVLAALALTRSAHDLRTELHHRAALLAGLGGSLTPLYPLPPSYPGFPSTGLSSAGFPSADGAFAPAVPASHGHSPTAPGLQEHCPVLCSSRSSNDTRRDNALEPPHLARGAGERGAGERGAGERGAGERGAGSSERPEARGAGSAAGERGVGERGGVGTGAAGGRGGVGSGAVVGMAPAGERGGVGSGVAQERGGVESGAAGERGGVGSGVAQERGGVGSGAAGGRGGVGSGVAVGMAPAGGVVSLGAPSAQAAVEWAGRCRDKGVAVGCFRPPSTPDNRSRLRLTVNVGVSLADFEHALEVIEQCRPSAG